MFHLSSEYWPPLSFLSYPHYSDDVDYCIVDVHRTSFDDFHCAHLASNFHNKYHLKLNLKTLITISTTSLCCQLIAHTHEHTTHSLFFCQLIFYIIFSFTLKSQSFFVLTLFSNQVGLLSIKFKFIRCTKNRRFISKFFH